MAIRVLTGAAILALMATPLAAQKRGDQATLVFTVSGVFIQGKGLWGVQRQPIQDNAFTDFYNLRRDIKSTLGASLSGTYYPGAHVGLSAEAFLVGMGYDDACTLDVPSESVRNIEVCNDIDKQEKSAAAVALSTGAVFRIAPREFISPFIRASAGLLLTNQSSVLTEGVSISNGGALLVVYDDESRRASGRRSPSASAAPSRSTAGITCGGRFAITTSAWSRSRASPTPRGSFRPTRPSTNTSSACTSGSTSCSSASAGGVTDPRRDPRRRRRAPVRGTAEGTGDGRRGADPRPARGNHDGGARCAARCSLPTAPRPTAGAPT